MYSPGFNQVHTVAEKINRKNPYSHCVVPDRIAHIIFNQQQHSINNQTTTIPTTPTALTTSTGGGLGASSSLNTSIDRPSTSPQSQQQQETTEQRFRRLCRLIPPRLSEYTTVTKSMPPGEQLLQIQRALCSLQYNFLPQTFFNLRKNRPLKRIFETAKEIITESLPIRCLEATFLALYLTQHMKDVKRIPLAFKSTCNGRNFRHIVLVVEMFGKFGVLGMSRRGTLMDRLPCRFTSLIDVVEDFRLAYKEVGHRLSTFKVGLYTTHNPQNYHLVPCWRFITLKMPLLAPQPPKALLSEPTTPTTSPRQHHQEGTPTTTTATHHEAQANINKNGQESYRNNKDGGDDNSKEEYLYRDGMYLTHSGIALGNLQVMLTKLSVQYHSGAFDLEPPAVTPNKASKPTATTMTPPMSPLTSTSDDPRSTATTAAAADIGVRQILFTDEGDDDDNIATSAGGIHNPPFDNNMDHGGSSSNSSGAAIDQEINAYILKESNNNNITLKSTNTISDDNNLPVLQVPLLEEVADINNNIAMASPSPGATMYPEEEEEDEDGGDSDTELNQCRTYCVLYCRSPFHPSGSLEQLLTTNTNTSSTTTSTPAPVSSPARAKALKRAALSAPTSSNTVASGPTAGDVARQAAEVCPGFEEFMAVQREIAAAYQAKVRQQILAQQKQLKAQAQQRKAAAAADSDCATAAPVSPTTNQQQRCGSRKGSASPQRRASTAGSGAAGVATPNRVGPQKAVAKSSGKTTPPPHNNNTKESTKESVSPSSTTKPPKASKTTTVTTSSDTNNNKPVVEKSSHQDKSHKKKGTDKSQSGDKTESKKTKRGSGTPSKKKRGDTPTSTTTIDDALPALTSEGLEEEEVAMATQPMSSRAGEHDDRDTIDGIGSGAPIYLGSDDEDGRGATISPDSVENFMPPHNVPRSSTTSSPKIIGDDDTMPDQVATRHHNQHNTTTNITTTNVPSTSITTTTPHQRLPTPVLLLDKGELPFIMGSREDSSSIRLSSVDILPTTTQHNHDDDYLDESNSSSTLPSQSVVRRLRSVIESCQSVYDDDTVVGGGDDDDFGDEATRVTSPLGGEASRSVSPNEGDTNTTTGTTTATNTTTPHPPLIDRRSQHHHLPRLVPSRSSSFVGPKIISLSFGSATSPISSSSPSRQLQHHNMQDVVLQGSPVQRLRTPSHSPQGSGQSRPKRYPSSKSLARTLPAGSSSSVASALVVEAIIKSPLRPHTSSTPSPSNNNNTTSPAANNKRDAWRDLDMTTL